MLIFSILFSLCLASFAGLVAIRLPLEKRIIFDRSRCDHCQHKLTWYQEIPIISYLYLRGHCSYCQKSIDPGIFIIEIIGLLIGLGAHFQYQYSPYLLIILVITVAACALTDLNYLYIWPVMLLPAVGATLCVNFPTLQQWLDLGLLAVTLLTIFKLLATKIGAGDLEVILTIALVIGVKMTLEVILIASFLALILVKIVHHHQKKLIPFIPFLLAGLIFRIILLLGPVFFDKFLTSASFL